MNEIAEHIVISDSDGNSLRGDRNYKLLLPPGIPVNNFWSVIVYDSHMRLIIKTDQPWPSVYSSCKKLVVNQDGSVDVWFGPKTPPGKENNWIQTIPVKCWYLILRLYEPMEAWINKSWKPGEIELI